VSRTSFDVRSLELFVAACECRSITHAAELHHISVSAISKRIAQLEQLIGTSLLTRTHAGVAPTNDGMRLFEHARTVLSGIEAIEQEMGNKENNLHGYVRIYANRSANAEFVPRSVASFLADPRHRNIDVHIAEMTSHEVVSGVKSGLATLGMCWAEADMAGVDWRPCGRDRLVAVVPTGHVLASRECVSFAETLDYEQVGIYSGGPVTNRLRRESMHVRKRLRYRVVASSFEAMIRFVEAGLVVAIMPSQVALRYVSSSAIGVIPLADAWKERQFGVCCRSRRALAKPAAEMFDHLLAGAESALV
jgi:DNA-binding transcriptional LysR family regulator